MSETLQTKIDGVTRQLRAAPRDRRLNISMSAEIAAKLEHLAQLTGSSESRCAVALISVMIDSAIESAERNTN